MKISLIISLMFLTIGLGFNIKFYEVIGYLMLLGFFIVFLLDKQII